MPTITTSQKRELLRFAIFFAIPLPMVFWWGEIRPDEPSASQLVVLALLAGTVFAVAGLIADWVVGRVRWGDIPRGAPPERPGATHRDPRWK